MLKFNNKVLNYNSRWLNEGSQLVLPPYTIRLLYRYRMPPEFNKGTGVQVSESPNVWDLTYNNTDWSSLLYNHTELLEVLGANTSDVTNMSYMFARCSALTTVPLFDTSNVTDMSLAFYYCSSLTTVPLFDTSKVTNVDGMLAYCLSVESGALALYNQMSSQTVPPVNHNMTFRSCGYLTEAGAAEVAQIPNDWK